MSDEVDLSKLGQKPVEFPPNVKLFPVNMMMVASLFQQGNIIHLEVLEGIPKDGKVLGIVPDPMGNIGLLVQSKEFPAIIMGSGPQVQNIVLKDLLSDEPKQEKEGGETDDKDVREKREDVVEP